jgi:hypothetical protein
MTATTWARALSFIIVSFVSSAMFAFTASANESTTTVVPTVPVAIAPGFDPAVDTTIGLAPRLTPAVGIVDPSTKSAPEVVSAPVTRPSVQATTPVVVPARPKSDTSSDTTVVKPVVQAPQIDGPANEASAPSVEVTRVAPQMIAEAPATTNTEAGSSTVTTAEPAEAQSLIVPPTQVGGPEAVWSYVGYGAIGAFVALYAYRSNARRSHSAS